MFPVNGANSNPLVQAPAESANCMNRIVRWFLDESNSTVLKISALASALIAVIGVALRLHCPLLIPLVIIPSAFWALREYSALNENRRMDPPLHPRVDQPHQWFDPTEMLAAQRIPFYLSQKRISDIFGDRQAMNRMAVLDDQFDGNAPILRPENLPLSIMRTPLFDIAVKVIDQEQNNRELVMTFFSNASDDAPGRWSHDIEGNTFSSDDGIQQADLLRQIVEGTHPRYVLV